MQREHPSNSASENANNSKDNQQANMINSSYDRDQKSSGSSEMPLYKSITIGDLTNSIITRDFEANAGNSRQLIGQYPNEWKPQQQQQQQPPPQRRQMKMYEGPNDKTSSDNMHISNQSMKYNCDISPVNFYNQPQQNSMNGLNIRGVKPLDRNSIQIPVMSTNSRAQQFQNMERYVKDKIVEVMRTEDARHEETQFERNDKSQQEVPEKRKDSLIKRHDDFQQYNKPITPTFPGQYYPYSALNVQNQNTSDILPTSTSSIPSSSIEPKPPLLSSQYEALSDED